MNAIRKKIIDSEDADGYCRRNRHLVFVREWMSGCACPAENWLSLVVGGAMTRRKDE
jgi:hypothetical protein